MHYTRIFFVLVLYCISFATLHGENSAKLITLSNDPLQVVEYITFVPKQKNYPVLLFLHGASLGKGLHTIPDSWNSYWLKKGYATAIISLPGFGGSTGPKDFCGPKTMEALHTAINAIKEELHVSRIGIIGFGQGSLAGALLAAQRNDILCLVCSNGGYDLVRHLDPDDALVNLFKNYSFKVTKEELKLRSPMEVISFIKAPIFILHRVSNPVISTDEVVKFAEALKAQGKECSVSLLPRGDVEDQKISYDEILSETEKWVDKHMRA